MLEDLLEILITPLWDLLFESKAKAWVKTLAYLLFTQGITLWILLTGLLSNNIVQTGRYVLSAIAAVWCIVTVIIGICKHQRNWEKI